MKSTSFHKFRNYKRGNEFFWGNHLIKKIKKLSSSFIVVLLVCMNFLIHLPYKAEAATTELKGLGDVSYYNAIIFGDHSATSADIEGAMAIQKK